LTPRPFGQWEREIAFRYLRARRKEGGVALISIISFVGIALAVAVLIIVMSVMNGFRAELLDRILGFNGHAFVAGPATQQPGWRDLPPRIVKVPGVQRASPIVESYALVQSPVQTTGGVVRGVRPEDLRGTALIADNIKQGGLATFGQGEFGGDVIVIGERLAQQLAVRAGDQLTLTSPTGEATVFGSTPRQKTYTIGAVFAVGMTDYDQLFIFMPLEQAQLFFGRGDSADFIEIMVSQPDAVGELRPAIARAAGPGAIVSDWRDKNAQFWGALQVERNVMRLILMLIVAIAAMNIISGLVMLVKNKGRDIAILRTMGAGQGAILRIFFLTGASIGAAATATGLAVGALFCIFIKPIQKAVEAVTGASVFNADVYFLTSLPAKIDWAEVVGVVFWALLASFVATLPPAWRASRLDPVEALRYE